MSGETEREPSGWTVDQLKQHYDKLLDEMDKRFTERFAAQERAVHDALAAAKEAVNKAETATEKRFESVNEFRGTLQDTTSRMMTRDESISRHDRTSSQITDLQGRIETENRLARERTDNDIKALRERHDQDIGIVNKRLDLNQGARQGIQQGWGFLVGAIGLTGGVIAIVVAVTR